MRSVEEFELADKTVLLRVDINSPIDPTSRKIVNTNRLEKSIPTISYLLEQGAKLAMVAHQGDTLDYQNLLSMQEHTEILGRLLGANVDYIDDVCGPAAQEKVRALKPGTAVLLGNLRYLSEEISTFENAVKLEPQQMLDTWLVRGLAPLVDIYVNDAFAAAHRNAPSMVAFQEIKPTAAGKLLFDEVTALNRVMSEPEHPSVFVLGGAKISDAFGMLQQVLETGTADRILACGITGEIMLLASGYRLGAVKEQFLKDRSLDVFVDQGASYLSDYPDKILYPQDLAYEDKGIRKEIPITELPAEHMYMDIGNRTIAEFETVIGEAKTLFVNGPPGVYENALFENGTRAIWNAIAAAEGYSVIGGGDTVTAATRFVDLNQINYVCTAGGAMVRYLSGKKLPLMVAMEKAQQR